ncbi:MAG TPA: hypothetical protein VJN88_04330 [Ktedonobacterales bacterium]|nr:hypothetical protein [Ktedonobacterales bacterium]
MSEPNDVSATPEPHAGGPRVSRRTLLRVTAGGLVASTGAAALYVTLSQLAPPAHRVYGPPSGGYPTGQYQIAMYGGRVQTDPESAVIVEIPPVWNLVITATLTRAPTLADQTRLEAALRAVESAYAYAPSGVFALVGWGLPYFRAHIPDAVVSARLPRTVDGTNAPALIDAVRFPSDPAATLLESNDVVFHLRSDRLDNLHDVQNALFGRSGKLAGRSAPAANVSDLFHVTSIRTGFVGAGLPRKMAQQAKLPFAGQIPETSPLFMGFTSTQKLGQASEETVSFDGKRDPLLPPMTTERPTDYFAGGTILHISHLFEDLDAWYKLNYDDRFNRMFNPGFQVAPGRVTVNTSWLNPNPTEPDASRFSVIGHTEAIQIGSRSPQGQALQLRVDFNTLDALDGDKAAPGVHFLSFVPTAQVFHASRMAMDATDITQRYQVPSAANGINSFLTVTRRQNFLIPPRTHRAFPLLELRG